MSRDYVFVGDVAEANVAAARRASSVAPGACRPFNIAGGVAIRTRTLFETLRDAAQVAVEASQAPARDAELKESCLDVQRAAAELPWQAATSLRSGLEQTLAYFRET